MKKSFFLVFFIIILFFNSCAFQPVYQKKGSLFSNKINIHVKSKDYDKKIPNLMKVSLNEKLNFKNAKPSNLKLVISLNRSISSLGYNKDLNSSARMVSYSVRYAFYDSKGLLTSGQIENKSSFFIGGNPYANVVSEENASKNLIISLSESLSIIILASRYKRPVVP